MLDNGMSLFAGYVEDRVKPIIGIKQGDDIEALGVFGSERQRRKFVSLLDHGMPRHNMF